MINHVDVVKNSKELEEVIKGVQSKICQEKKLSYNKKVTNFTLSILGQSELFYETSST